MKMMSTSISCPTSERFANSRSNDVGRIAHCQKGFAVGLSVLASGYAIVAGASRANVLRRLNAKTVTAAISQIADVGSKDHAEGTIP